MNSGDHSGREPYGEYSGPATITGGSIDNTPIGQTAAAPGYFTEIHSVLGWSAPGGTVTNDELLTLQDIDTSVPIQTQIDNLALSVSGKEPIITLLSLAKGGTGVDSSASIAQNAVFAAPSASSGAASFRVLTSDDLPADLTIRSISLATGDSRLVLEQEAPESQPGVHVRWYTTDQGDWIFAFNASWDNGTDLWSQDDPGPPSFVHRLPATGGLRIQKKNAGASPWNDTSWDVEDLYVGEYLESSTTRTYDFGIWFSVRTVGDYIGGCVQFPVQFPGTPTSLTFNITASSGVNTGSITAWSTTPRSTQWGIQSTAFTGWVAGTVTVGF